MLYMELIEACRGFDIEVKNDYRLNCSVYGCKNKGDVNIQDFSSSIPKIRVVCNKCLKQVASDLKYQKKGN